MAIALEGMPKLLARRSSIRRPSTYQRMWPGCQSRLYVCQPSKIDRSPLPTLACRKRRQGSPGLHRHGLLSDQMVAPAEAVKKP
jgi:hypothetical protein